MIGGFNTQRKNCLFQENQLDAPLEVRCQLYSGFALSNIVGKKRVVFHFQTFGIKCSFSLVESVAGRRRYGGVRGGEGMPSNCAAVPPSMACR